MGKVELKTTKKKPALPDLRSEQVVTRLWREAAEVTRSEEPALRRRAVRKTFKLGRPLRRNYSPPE